MASFLRTPETRFNNLPSFSYKPHYVNLPSSKEYRLAYIDESTPNYSPQKSEIFLCLHGVPAYSYLYRKVIPILLSSNKSHGRGVRVICPDFIGWGRSDKPTNADVHKFEYHRNTMIELLKYLNLDNNKTNITLICQDWGGLIGLTLPMAFISYDVDNDSNKVIQHDNNPIKRVIFFNTFIPLGIMGSKSFLKWRQFTRNAPDLNISALMRAAGLEHLSKEELCAYSAPFVNKNYKLAPKCWPSNVPIHPDYPGLDIWNKAFMFWQRNKLSNQIKLFQCHGCRDIQFTVNVAKNVYQQMIGQKTSDNLGVEYGISSETGGILFVPNTGHFVQESPEIEWIINKALKYFGDIPYEDVEYEWILSPNTNKINIVKILLNQGPVNVLSYNLVNGLNDIFSKFNNSKYCDGFILTSNMKYFSAGNDLSLFAKKDRDLAKRYFYAKQKLRYLLQTSKKPIIAGINGGAIAGGTILALNCDYRIMFNDTFISMNEVRNGIQFKSKSIFDYIKRFVGSDDKAMYVLQTGQKMYGEKAKELGLIHETIKGERNRKALLDECIRVLEQDYFPADKEASYIARKLARNEMIVPMENISNKDADAWVDTFFAPKVQKAIQKLFSKKAKSRKTLSKL